MWAPTPWKAAEGCFQVLASREPVVTIYHQATENGAEGLPSSLCPPRSTQPKSQSTGDSSLTQISPHPRQSGDASTGEGQHRLLTLFVLSFQGARVRPGAGRGASAGPATEDTGDWGLQFPDLTPRAGFQARKKPRMSWWPGHPHCAGEGRGGGSRLPLAGRAPRCTHTPTSPSLADAGYGPPGRTSLGKALSGHQAVGSEIFFFLTKHNKNNF